MAGGILRNMAIFTGFTALNTAILHHILTVRFEC
jgi:hypothetical protein